MRKSLRLKRLLISVVLLLCGVFALYPYLASRPMRNLRRSVSGLEKTQAQSVLGALALGENIAARARALAAKGENKAALTDLAEQLEKETKQLKTTLLTMSERATKLTEEAARLYTPLDERLNRVILSMTEGAK